MSEELPDGSKIKLIATDLDGTLLNQRGVVSERTKAVINKILNKYPDIHFVIATGRTRPSTMKIRKSLGIIDRPNTESLNSNGCVIYDSYGKIIWQGILPTEYVLKFHNYMKIYPKAAYMYASEDKIIVFDERWARTARENAQENTFFADKEEQIKHVESGKCKINKISYIATGPEASVVKEKLEELRKEYDLAFAQSLPWFLEYMPHETNKGTGITQLIKQLGITKDEVIAFGDGGNDLELLQSVGWPVAMGNACDALKPFAKLTAKTNIEDGVADMLERIFLKEEQLN